VRGGVPPPRPPPAGGGDAAVFNVAIISQEESFCNL